MNYTLIFKDGSNFSVKKFKDSKYSLLLPSKLSEKFTDVSIADKLIELSNKKTNLNSICKQLQLILNVNIIDIT
jgi:hypothetical protein